MGFSLNSYTRMILLIFTRMHATLHYVGWLVSHFPLFVCPSVSNTIKFWTIQSVLRKRKRMARKKECKKGKKVGIEGKKRERKKGKNGKKGGMEMIE